VLFNNQDLWWDEGNLEQYKAIKQGVKSDVEAEFVVDGVMGRKKYLSDSTLLRISYPISKLTLLGM
jgi:hypothetical protein